MDTPARVGKYELRREIARGGMAAVYEAVDTTLGRRVALKIIREQPGAEKLTARLQREAQIVAQLSHLNIVTVHEIGEDRDPLGGRLHFIAMDLVEGGTMADAIARGRAGRDDCLRMLEETARAVAYAHSKGVVHRDIKPANVLVDRDGRARLSDFGLARDRESKGLTLTNAVIGTPAYMAPEQVAGRQADIDARTDVYALGVVLYEILTGMLPFGADSAAGIYERILVDEPLPPRRANASVPRDLEIICLKAMEKERGRRYATAAEFADDIGRFRRGEAIRARPASVTYRVQKVLARRKFVVVAGAAVAVAVALGWSLRGRPPASDEHLRDRLRPIEGVVRETRSAFYIAGVDIRERLARVERACGELEALSRDPAAGRDVWVTLGMALYFTGQTAEAERAFERAGDDGWANYYRARILVERAMIESLQTGGEVLPTQRAPSRALMERAAELLGRPTPSWVGAEDVDRHVALAWRALASGDRDEALRLCDEGLSRFAGALGREEYWCVRGWLSEREGRAQAYEAALAIRPHYAWASFMLGTERSARDREGAVRAYDAAIAANPRMTRAYENRGILHAAAGRLGAAMDDFAAALKLEPGSYVALLNRGNAHWSAGDRARAIADYDAAIAASPERHEAHLSRSTVRLLTGDTAGAMADAERAIAIGPTLGLPYMRRAVAREKLGDIEGARADHDRAVANGPQLAQVWSARGTFRFGRRDYDGAVADLSEALDRDPYLHAALSNRATAYVLTQRPQEAKQDFLRLVELEPRNAYAWANLGSLYANGGELRAAATAYEKALASAPSDWPHRADVERSLGQAKQRLGE